MGAEMIMRKFRRIFAWVLAVILFCSQVSIQTLAQGELQNISAAEVAIAETMNATEAIEAIETAEAAEDASNIPATETVEATTEVTEIETESDALITDATTEFMPMVSDSDEMFFMALDDGEEVSRLEWLKALTNVFQMSVEEDNYPDNYYSDIDATSEDYYDVMLATEFGLVDVEAGEALRPNEAATREFAAHTLNLCLGYLLDTESGYTFQDASSAIYPDDIQIAVNRGWFALQNGNFLPQQPITAAERDKMLQDAREVKAAEIIDSDYSGSYQFVSDVIVVPEGTRVELTDENQLTIYDCSVILKAGDKFGIVYDGFPVVHRVEQIALSENRTIVTFSNVATQDAFVNIDVQGNQEADLTQLQVVGENAELQYIVGGTEEQNWEDGQKFYSLELVGEQEISAVEITQFYDIPENVRRGYEIEPGKKIELVCKVSGVKYDYQVDKSGVYVGLNAKVSLQCNVEADVLEASGIEKTVSMYKAPVGCVGFLTGDVELKFGGKCSFVQDSKVSMGVKYTVQDGFRLVKSFQKEAFTISTEAEVSMGVKLAFKINYGVMEGSIYARFGAKARVKAKSYSDGKIPTTCADVGAWLFMDVGCQVKVDLWLIKVEWKEEKNIFNENNSPVRVYFHFDDGQSVQVCGRKSSGDAGESGEDVTPGNRKYYTPINSQYGFSNLNSGTTLEGEPFAIFEYSLDKKDQATITKYNGNVSALNIPDTLDGHSVVGIGEKVFAHNSKLRMVVISDSITSIGAGAFGQCENLSSVKLPKSLKTMGAHAFYNCDNLKEVEIPKSLTETSSAYIYEFAYNYQYGPFFGCDNLKSIIFEEGTTKIAKGLFANCPGIESITIPDTVTSIAESAFFKCNNLKNVMFSDAITTIDKNAFYQCSSLSNVKLPEKLEYLGYMAFGDCDSISSIEIPQKLSSAGVESIWLGGGPNYRDGGPFTYCDNLKEVVFEEGTTKIADNLLTWCENLETVQIPDSVTVINSSAFQNCWNLKTIDLPSTIISIGPYAFRNCYALEEIILPDSLRSIGEGSFNNCDSLTSIEIPKSLKSIWYSSYSEGPFTHCDKLKEVRFEEGTTTIVMSILENCYFVEKVIIPNTVTQIESGAFSNCQHLTDIVIPNSVEKVGNRVFEYCYSLENITLSNVLELGTDIFSQCKNLKEVILPQNITYIPMRTFENCVQLEQIDIPESVIGINSYAFKNTGLMQINLPENTQNIGTGAFQNCTALTKVTMGNQVKVIGNYAFNNCDALTDVRLPDSVTSLGTHVFEDCELLGGVMLGTGITKIPAYAFNLCPSLEKIVLPYQTGTVDDNAFTNCVKLKELTVPRAVTNIGNAFSYPIKMTVYGVSGTYAEEWANNVNATFVAQEKPATSVTLRETSVTVNIGSNKTLLMTIAPADFTDEVTWKSSNTSVATVSDSGVVTAKALGEAQIQVNVGNVRASCKVTVRQPVTSISLNKTSYSMEAEQTYTLKATVSPSNANDKSVAWSSSDESVATVDAMGKVTALRKGNAVITATAQDGSGISKSCSLTVTNTIHKCNEVAAMESPHNYENNCSDVWIYTLAGANKIAVTFDARTEVEDGFDFIYLYDASGKEIGKYTGKSLAGQTISLEGNTIKVKLVSDKAGENWGFKVSSVEQRKEAKAITGVINCRAPGNTQMTIQLLDAGGREIAQTKVSGNGSEYALEDVAAGTYTLRVSKTNCVSRDYKITLGEETQQMDMELCLVGDTSKDGKISVQDNRMVYNHIAGIKKLEGYDFLVGDVNGDGKISVQDNRMIYNHIAGIKALW
ncbi:MAG: leucine-rich repeat protein [Lachnoclostridium sp.]|nr:leucine-rich repeat protein [Lachnospira sp.]MCM1247470.1 leucine-rich repeat protein [Lachnoclostridium sp.]